MNPDARRIETCDLTSNGFWAGRRVLVTGHTGFKGAWLALWLEATGADVYGLALKPNDVAGAYGSLGPWAHSEDAPVDIRDAAAVRERMVASGAEVVFHLAAQAVVRQGYADPVGTYATNVVGTANVLEECVHLPDLRAAVIVTSDKVYANGPGTTPFREDDRMGGDDPYSASKACAELVVAAWRRSTVADRHVAVATARAGNVIGGGDTAVDRLLPDVQRALAAGRPLRLRYPTAVRPWQHVLEPVAGYLLLAERLATDAASCPPAVNFGPGPDACRSVAEIAELAFAVAGTGAWEPEPVPQPPEHHVLTLDSSLAAESLGWRPRLTIDEAVGWTVDWWNAQQGGLDLQATSLEQIREYVARAQT